MLILKNIFFKEINTKKISGFLKLTAGKVHGWLRQLKNSLENAYCIHSLTHSLSNCVLKVKFRRCEDEWPQVLRTLSEKMELGVEKKQGASAGKAVEGSAVRLLQLPEEWVS